MKELLLNYISDPRDPIYNWELARDYEVQGQKSAAICYYLRSAEFSYDDLHSYECLLHIALCFEFLGNRNDSVQSILLRAVSLLPKRPEAYFLLSRSYERSRKWQEAYAWSVVGEQLEEPKERIGSWVEYPGKYGFTFERAVTSWWVGLYDESHYLFRKLKEMSGISPEYVTMINSNLNFLANSSKRPIKYEQFLYPKLKVKFPGAENIKINYSLAYQDMFVLTMLNGMKNGRFVEIGCGDPFFNNNTALLEKEFNWVGISIDIMQHLSELFQKKRKATCICADATKINYRELLKGNYEYLQVDCDPSDVSLSVLKRIPFEHNKFAVITFEHDYYLNVHKEVRDLSRKYLKSFGYQLVINNVSEDRFSPFEDWWVHPDLISQESINRLSWISDDPKKADLCLLNQ